MFASKQIAPASPTVASVDSPESATVPFTENERHGDDVAIPTFPSESIRNVVVVAVADDVDTANRFDVPNVLPEIDRLAHGVLVPIPRRYAK